MAKDFNVYQWRREHLNENQESFSDAFKKDNEVNNFTQGEKNDYAERYFDSMISQNENQEGLKVSTVTFDQVKGMKLPYDITGGAYIEILRPNVFDEWKDRFMRVYGDADLKANGDKLIARSEKVDTLQARAASDIRGAVGTVD
jgi:hypothetical protein